MQLLHVAVLFLATVQVLGQTYEQGVVGGATLALAGTAVLGVGLLALQNSQRNRGYRYRTPYAYNYGYGGYNQPNYHQHQHYHNYQQPYYGTYHRPGYYRRRRDTSLEEGFEKVLSKDKQQCALRVVCELEARRASGEQLDDYSSLILSLFSNYPGPVSERQLGTAQGKYAYAAYVGAQSDVKTCAELYSTCKYSSKVILSLIKIARQSRDSYQS